MGQRLPNRPLSGETPKQDIRNQIIRDQFANGSSLSELASCYQISSQRIWQIVHGRRK